ncbi:uncharacterized protein [Amphiura filiformis]|uniref:uncharacterized protein n=1 Tax=Amphiura filiformis TaxID=82378 RepID=UPI003B225FC3
MDVRQIFSFFVLATFTCYGSAIQCHQCLFENITSTIRGQSGCMDPLESSEIELVECDGQCYANVTAVSNEFYDYNAVYRGCTTDSDIDCSFQGCQMYPGTRLCAYCCDKDDCNSRSFEEVDADIFKCYQCQAELTPDGMPVDNNTCGRDDFDGTGDPLSVFAFACPSETCITFTTPPSPPFPASITRSCAVEELLDVCTNNMNKEIFEMQGYGIECCQSDLCNVGESPVSSPVSPTELLTTPKPKPKPVSKRRKYWYLAPRRARKMRKN